MMKILFATGNETKAKRFSKGLLENDIEVVTLKDVDINIEVEENGNTAIENALIKARSYYNETGMITMAMDDNLYIEGIPDELQPGMFVRRVNGKRLNDDEMIEYYSGLAKKYGKNGLLTAKWVYGMAIINNGIEKTYTWSNEEYYISDIPVERRHAGYPLDSISINKVLNKYFVDLTDEDKKQIGRDETHVVNFIVESCK